MTQAEIRFLKRIVPSSDPSGFRWDWPQLDDINIIEVSGISAGPVKPMVESKVHGKSLLHFCEEVKAYENYKSVVKFGFPSPQTS